MQWAQASSGLTLGDTEGHEDPGDGGKLQGRPKSGKDHVIFNWQNEVFYYNSTRGSL